MNGAAAIDFADMERKPSSKTHKQLGSVLMVPWRSTHRGLRWLSLAVVAGCLLGAIAVGRFGHDPDWRLLSVGIYCFGALYAWAFWLSTSLLLAIDARKLRLPGMQRAAYGSVLFYGLLMIALPTLVLGAFGADALAVALLAALAATGGLAFALLPRWLSIWFGFLPALNIGLRHFVQYPPLSDPRWLTWGALALAVLLIVNALRWRHLLHNDTDNELGFNSAMVMQFRRHGAASNWSGLQQLDCGQMIRQRPDWMQPRADLRRTGPQHPVRALRVALGGWFMPKTLIGHLRTAAPVLLPMLLMIPVMALIAAGNHPKGETLIGFGAGLGWGVTFGGMMLPAMTTMLVRQRWQRTNTELPLLALLPGLGDAQRVRRSLLCAVLTIPVAVQLLLLLVVLLAAWVSSSRVHLGGLTLPLVVLPQLAAAGTMIAEALCTIGGRKLSTRAAWLLYTSFGLLFLASTLVPLSTLGNHPWQAALRAETWLLAAWAAFALALAWIGRRGWRGLLAQPHLFLPN